MHKSPQPCPPVRRSLPRPHPDFPDVSSGRVVVSGAGVQSTALSCALSSFWGPGSGLGVQGEVPLLTASCKGAPVPTNICTIFALSVPVPAEA